MPAMCARTKFVPGWFFAISATVTAGENPVPGMQETWKIIIGVLSATASTQRRFDGVERT